jgi:hypothetical protein
MRTLRYISVLALCLLLLPNCILPETAEGKSPCRKDKGGSLTAALGEEFPERPGDWVFALGLWTTPPALLWSIAEALGEEFPELAGRRFWLDALGEEFPESVGRHPSSAALGEEFPERAGNANIEALGEEFPE